MFINSETKMVNSPTLRSAAVLLGAILFIIFFSLLVHTAYNRVFSKNRIVQVPQYEGRISGYTVERFGYTIGLTTTEIAKFAISCGKIQRGSSTSTAWAPYCENNSTGLKISLLWKRSVMTEASFQDAFTHALLVDLNIRKDLLRDTSCTTTADTENLSINNGKFVNCKLTIDTKKPINLSWYYFDPGQREGISQVLAVSDQGKDNAPLVEATIHSIARKITPIKKVPENNTPLSIFQVEKAYAAGTDDAQCVSVTGVPATMMTNTWYNVSVTFKNTGTSVWRPYANANPMYLAISTSGEIGASETMLSTDVNPGEQVTIPMTARANYVSSSGSYDLVLQMARQNAGVFGSPCTASGVMVVPNPLPSVNVSVTPDTDGAPASETVASNQSFRVDMSSTGADFCMYIQGGSNFGVVGTSYSTGDIRMQGPATYSISFRCYNADSLPSAWQTATVYILAPTQCSNGKDDDLDTLIDFPNDPGCTSYSDNTEDDPGGGGPGGGGGNGKPQCSDGKDNDGDNLVDFPNDPGCTSYNDTDETDNPICGDLICNGSETCSTCESDCGVCPVPPTCPTQDSSGCGTPGIGWMGGKCDPDPLVSTVPVAYPGWEVVGGVWQTCDVIYKRFAVCPASATVNYHGEQQYKAYYNQNYDIDLYCYNATQYGIDVTNDPGTIWQTASSGVASVNYGGVKGNFRGEAANGGSTKINASYKNESESTAFNVLPQAAGKVLVSPTVTPAKVTTAQTAQLALNTTNATACTWTMYKNGVVQGARDAIVDPAFNQSVGPYAAGVYRWDVYCTGNGAPGSGSVSLDVVPAPTAKHLVVCPLSAVTHVGDTQQYDAYYDAQGRLLTDCSNTGVFGINVTTNVSMSWFAGDYSVVNIVGPGKYLGIDMGYTSVTASFNTYMASAQITVLPALPSVDPKVDPPGPITTIDEFTLSVNGVNRGPGRLDCVWNIYKDGTQIVSNQTVSASLVETYGPGKPGGAKTAGFYVWDVTCKDRYEQTARGATSILIEDPNPRTNATINYKHPSDTISSNNFGDVRMSASGVNRCTVSSSKNGVVIMPTTSIPETLTNWFNYVSVNTRYIGPDTGKDTYDWTFVCWADANFNNVLDIGELSDTDKVTLYVLAQPPVPDLVPYRVDIPVWPTYIKGMQIPITITVKNSGRSDAVRSFWDTTWADWSFLPGDFVGSRFHPFGLAIGNTLTDVYSYVFPYTGSMDFRGNIDTWNNVDEGPYENNNTWYGPFVTVVDPSVSVDLRPVNLKSSGTLTVGNTVTFTGNVQNIGVTGAGATHARFCIDNVNCGTDTTGRLAGGDIAVAPLGALTTGGDTSDTWVSQGGVHTVTMCADVQNEIGEADEANNCTSLSVPICSPTYDTVCTSAANTCKNKNVNVYTCGGVCPATTLANTVCPGNPPVTDPPTGDTCDKTNCGLTNTGTVMSDGRCSAEAPAGGYCGGTSCVANAGRRCVGPANSCGMVVDGTISCSGTCSANKPDESFCDQGGFPIIATTCGTIDFGQAEPNSGLKQKTCTISNVGSGVLTGSVNVINTVKSGFSCLFGCTLSVSNDTPQTVTIGWNPVAAGNYQGTLSVSGSNGGTIPNANIIADAAYKEVTGSLDFGNVRSGEVKTLPLVITNNNAITTVPSGTLVNVNSPYSCVPNCSFSPIAPGGQVTINILFSPTTIGLVRKTPTLSSFPPGSTDIMITGKGIPSSVKVIEY